MGMPQLDFFVRSLLNTECTFLWMYTSRLVKLVKISSFHDYEYLRRNEKNLDFFQSSESISNIIDDLLNQDVQKQTILFFNFGGSFSEFAFFFKALQNDNRFNLIVFCQRGCFEIKITLPRNRYVIDFQFRDHNPANIHLNKVLYDLALNPSYDRFDNRLGHYEDLKTQCSNSTINIAFYSSKWRERLFHIFFLAESLISKFPSIIVHVYHEDTLKEDIDDGYKPILVDLGLVTLPDFDNYEKKIRVLVDGESSSSNDGMITIRTTKEDLYSVDFFNKLVKSINFILCR